MSKHLTLTDRAIIEKYLAQDMSFSFIAKRLNRSATTISREIKNHRCFVNGFRYTSNDCINYRSCLRRNICDQESIYTCSHRCKTCTEFDCKSLCIEDDLALLASVRECTKNGIPEPKEGFYQYSAAWDSKHKVTLEDGKSARVLFELQQMTDGGTSI